MSHTPNSRWDWTGHSAKCHTQTYLPNGTAQREFQIDQQGRVWPCCLILNNWRFHPNNAPAGSEEPPLWIVDAWDHTPELQSALEEDPYFNSLDHHTWEEIMNHSMFRQTWHPNRYNNENVSSCAICVANCGAWTDRGKTSESLEHL